MIIKSKSYKTTKSFNTVLDYIFRENEKNYGFELTKFIKGKNLFPEELSSQFRFNEQFRINQRKNSVVLYMDILSFHPRDAERLTNDKLHQIALKYLSLRAPKSIAVATVHRNEKYHTHLHLVFSGIEYKTGKSIRMSKEDFQNKVKIPMEKYQQEVFPELMLSKINHEKLRFLQKEQKKDSEIIMENEGEISEKKKILKLLEEVFTTVTSEKDFYQKLESKNIKLYSRNGKITGIEGNRKFRFSRLGYTPELLQSLEQNPTLNQRLEWLRNIRENSHEKERKW
ncbi:relaxase/mobilization nuclease domain-containing protein [Chryseobacterium aquaticum]|uniref:Relaxase/mobilization nuclease domain-containing protein n=1 Tax=Chryseobacterium aquaticum TaxID=452084 RepID=A0A848N1K0_9FLAO|nr:MULTISPECIES: relaxase/mobilization nuclease domain-containing protein [Chryseobacterium]NMR34957.1 relaxase/mobilization nuclease domain-containing protein [Chryseobacterium aquaticum]NRQ47179.1 relaxase/mobilization nuclease domain-containing protein [Chryseobacterium sp. C-204]